MSVAEEATKIIGSIHFTLISPSEIRKLSAVEIQTADTYDEDGVPIVSGLMDGRLGTLEPRQKCKTCGNTASACPGHFGHIELAEPVAHVAFAKLLHKLLQVTCRNCGRILLSAEKIKAYNERMQREQKQLNEIPASFYEAVMKDAKKTQECPHCGARQFPIEHGKPTTFHEMAEGGAARLNPSQIRERLERVPDDDLRLLGMEPTAARPEWMILQVLPVPAVTVRPSITLESGIRSEDDLTHKLVDIIRINQKLKEALESGVPVNIIQELHELLQYHVTTYFDNEVSGLPPARHRSGRALKTLSQRLKGKEGRFRGNLSGKRVDFSARTVISPDPNIDINEVGVPLDVAQRLTIPERVTPWNLDELKQLIRNGPDQYPGALYIVRPDGRRVRLEFVTEREGLAEAIQPGFVVERHIRDGDIVLFNRQPSLHRMSIMAHIVKVLPYKTFRLNPCVCISPDTRVMADGVNRPIDQLRNCWKESQVNTCDWAGSKEMTTTTLKAFWGLKPKDYGVECFKLVTKTGREIRATGDHPFYTARGRVPAFKLRVGDRVVVYPNDFPEYDETDRVILSEDEIMANAPKQTYTRHTLEQLRKLNLSTIKQLNNPRVPILARIIGHIFGDGTLILKGKVARVVFRGPEADLKDIQKDIRFLGFEPERIRSEKHKVKIQAANGMIRTFTGEGNSFEVRNKPFVVLLRALGAPAGDKVKCEYTIPKWIRNGPEYLRREFISSYFGCELTKPALRKKATTEFKEPVFKLAKITPKLRAGRKLAEEFKQLLIGFGVTVTSVRTYPGNIRKDGFTSMIIQVTLSSSLESMLNLYGHIGYSYNRDADARARRAYEYYRHKKAVLGSLAASFRLVKRRVSSGWSVAEAARQANVPYNTALDWVRRKKKAGLPNDFPDFNQYARETFRGLEHGLGYDEVQRLEKTELPYVYDITTSAETHNFVANEFLTGNCPPYNADFDGDEMNLHVPQGEEARTEAKLLMQVQDQILSPRYGGPIIGAKTDLLTAAYLLTRKSTYLTKEEVGKLLTAAGFRGEIPAPEIKRPSEMWSGKQIFSLFLPAGFSFVAKSSMSTQEDGSSVVVKEGKLVEGVIDKNTIGAERSETLFHRIVKDNGPEPGRIFLNGLIKLLDRFITLRGFTYGIDELDISDGVRDKISKAVQRAEERVQELIEQYKRGTLERLPGRSMEESLELRIMDELSKARDTAGELAEQYLKTETDNSGVIMTKTGARGSMLNIAQMVATVGQQSIRGQRIQRGYRDRALSFFEKGDVGAEARGFVYAPYQEGLTPVEFFFHSMGGREGLVDTAVRTQQSGYMQRRLINALEHIRVEYDGTVRDSRGDIIQFRYGEDGVDTAKSDHGKAVNTERLVERVELTIEKGAKAGKAYVEKKVKDVEKDLTPSLAAQLETSLLERKLTRRGVDEAIKEAVKNYRKSMIEPGEAAGIVSAQSIGEPGTQMTLRTFHFAGVREQNVTLGLPRLIEIVDARKIPSTPMMVVFLDKKHRGSREKAQEVATNITHTTLGDIATSIESDITKMRIVVTLNSEAMKEREVGLKDIKAAVTPGGCKVEVEKNTVHIMPQEMDIPQFNRLVLRLPLMHVKGIPQVKRALVMEEKTGDKSEWVIRTEGSNLELTLETEGVDPTRTTSNNMHEVAEVLGIEAARNVIIREATSVLEEQGLDVDVRHVMLVADAMTASGEVLQVGRHGVSGEKASTLAKAAFEITIPTIVDAAIKGTRDTLRGVAENVIVGQQVPMGTGLIEVYMSMPEKGKK